jgi:DNA-binding NtrC family response regulator
MASVSEDHRGGRGLPWPVISGLRVFVVEDEILVAMSLEDMLSDFGCTPVGMAASVKQALAAIDRAEAIDAAILDVNLNGEMVFPVSDMLQGRGVPFVFSTGHGTPELVQRYPGCRLLNKPYRPDALAHTLVDLIRSRRPNVV